MDLLCPCPFQGLVLLTPERSSVEGASTAFSVLTRPIGMSVQRPQICTSKMPRRALLIFCWLAHRRIGYSSINVAHSNSKHAYDNNSVKLSHALNLRATLIFYVRQISYRIEGSLSPYLGNILGRWCAPLLVTTIK